MDTQPHRQPLTAERHDRDAERLAHELFIQRQLVFPERPDQVTRSLSRTLTRLRQAARSLHRRLAAG